MSAGRLSEGAGCITWWGFNPARDLLSMGESLRCTRKHGPTHVRQSSDGFIQCWKAIKNILLMYSLSSTLVFPFNTSLFVLPSMFLLHQRNIMRFIPPHSFDINCYWTLKQSVYSILVIKINLTYLFNQTMASAITSYLKPQQWQCLICPIGICCRFIALNNKVLVLLHLYIVLTVPAVPQYL